MTHRQMIAALMAVPAILLGFAANASDPGVSSDRILLGQAAVFEGPAAALGVGMRTGLNAAFAEANRAGGVHGRRIELVGENDGYEPNASIEAVRKLIEQKQVFALVGPVGTPTVGAHLPVAKAAGVPVIGPFTGAVPLRAPAFDNAIHVRASYDQETEVMVERLTKDLGYTRIAILYQDDGFGRAGHSGIQKALTKRGMTLAAEGTFERNTVAVRTGLLAVRKGDPQAVVIIGPYKPAAEFIKLARQIKLKATFVAISFVGATALAKELGPAGEGVVVTQVVPLPWDSSIPLVGQYQAAIKAVDPAAEPEFTSLEGYAVGRATLAALQRMQGEPSRAGLLKAFAAGPIDLGGMTLTYGPDDREGSDTVFLTVIDKDGRFRAVDRLEAAP